MEETPGSPAGPQDAGEEGADKAGSPATPAAEPAVARPAAARPVARPAAAAGAAPAKPAAPGAAARPAAHAAPAGPPKPTPEEIRAQREKIVTLLEEKRRLGEPVTISVEHKSIQLTGRVIRIEPEEGFAVIEHEDGRRRGLWFILGGFVRTADGQQLDFPVDGVPR